MIYDLFISLNAYLYYSTLLYLSTISSLISSYDAVMSFTFIDEIASYSVAIILLVHLIEAENVPGPPVENAVLDLFRTPYPVNVNCDEPYPPLSLMYKGAVDVIA